MPRPARYVLPGQPLHVIQRGNNRSRIFAAQSDYRLFYECLMTACEKYRCSLHAYVFMPNHVHLVITPSDECGISSALQSVGRRYVRRFNDFYGRTGTLWEGRYRATLIDSDRYLLTCYRYVELNPVRAGVAARPEEYDWSSYRANAFGHHDPLVTMHDRYSALGVDTSSRCAAYRDLFFAPVDEQTISDIRNSTNKGWPLGNDRFRYEVAALTKRRTHPLTRGGDRRSVAYRANGTGQDFNRL
jgi:putative transposase